MKGDHTVILTERDSTRDLTPWVDGLEFGNANPGGYASVTFDLARDINAEEFEAFAEVAVYDSATGEQVGGGRMSIPGRGVNALGVGVWKVGVLGEGLASTQDRKVPYIVIDTRQEPSWVAGNTTNPRFSWAQGEPSTHPDAKPGWTFTMAPGSLNSGNYGYLNYFDMEQYASIEGDHRIEIAGIGYKWICGNGTNTNRVRCFIGEEFSGVAEMVADDPFDMTNVISRRRQITADWAPGGIGGTDPVRRAWINYRRSSSSVVIGGDDDWMHVFGFKIASLRLDQNRDPILDSAAYQPDHVLSHDVVIDAVARFCPRLDIENATVALGLYEWDSLVWPDGVNVRDVLAELLVAEPWMTWAVYEKQENGLYRFEWRDTDEGVNPRYVVDESALVDFELTGGEEERLEEFWYTGLNAEGYYGVAGWINILPQFEALNIRTSDTDTSAHEGASGGEWVPGAQQLALGQIYLSLYRSLAARAVLKGNVYDRLKNRWINASKMEPGWNLTFTPYAYGFRVTENGDTFSLAGAISTTTYSEESGETTVEVNSRTVEESAAVAAMMSGRRDLQ